ncbi:MAG TPA: PhaM family polyhydroxyalkanoate granule multifunctional regulatory protein [Hydrogenophaga sp.]|nr:PhaM family polyhydroxyalkanoate granule multifunctional regulatory protein [Hydrogenophaga sp.]
MSDTSGFGKFVPGFEFLQNLAGQAAGGVAQGLEKSIPQLPNLGNWVAPTFNVEDLEKRIEELKAVHFWLDQNAKALGATIQALEVQKMTLATLKSMNFSLGDVANALKIKAADTMAGFAGSPPAPAPGTTQFAGLEVPARTYGMPASAPEPEDEEEIDEEEDAEEPAPPPVARKTAKGTAARKGATASAPAGGTIDPVQWWGALSQQFQNIATNAMKDVAKQTTLDTTRKVASGLTEQAVKTTTGMAGKATRAVTSRVARNVGAAAGMGKAAVRAVSSGRRAPASKAPAPAKARKPAVSQQPMAAGDWPLPTAFFPGFQAAPAPSTPTKTPARKTASKATAKATPKAATKKTAAKKAPGKKAAVPRRR